VTQNISIAADSLENKWQDLGELAHIHYPGITNNNRHGVTNGGYLLHVLIPPVTQEEAICFAKISIMDAYKSLTPNEMNEFTEIVK
jgi:hypothetical protein